jgi:hypothetical protein
MMSRSAVLASAATETALRDAGWSEAPEEVGYYLGVGASGGSVDQLTAMLAASIEEREFSLARFGDGGLRACNPLFAFQLMNNFTLCHSAILHGTQGPNAAFFSRGSGTVIALLEAVHAFLDNESDRVLAGGADSGVHSVTWAELLREGWPERGLVPGEGAAILALGEPSDSSPALGFVDYISVRACRVKTVAQALAEEREKMGPSAIDAVLLVPWGPPARDALLSFAAESFPGRVVLDVSPALGESLAASPALAWAVALDLLAVERYERVLVLSAGLDGDVGLVTIRSGASG